MTQNFTNELNTLSGNQKKKPNKQILKYNSQINAWEKIELVEYKFGNLHLLLPSHLGTTSILRAKEKKVHKLKHTQTHADR